MVETLIQKVACYIREYDLLPRCPQKLIVGLSGGVDSSVLLYVMNALGYSCCAAHCNFHLRSEEAKRDEMQAMSLASSMNIVFLKKDFNTFDIAKQKGISIEMAARYLRYEWFEQLRKKQDAQAIVVAHHRNDDIETLLLNLIRGTGLSGLTGIKKKNGYVIRPLLNIDKREIVKFAEDNRINYEIDSSNLKNECKRNKIRLTLIPYLKTLNPSIERALFYTLTHLKEVEKIYKNYVNQIKNKVFDQNLGVIALSELRKSPSPESILFEILKEYDFNRKTIETIAHGINSLSGKEFYSPKYVLIKDRKQFFLTSRQEDQRKIYEISKNDQVITVPFLLQIDYKEVNDDFRIICSLNRAYLDERKIHFPLKLRKWERGDRFIPFGMRNFQKLSDYFNNNKFSKLEKKKTWVLCCGKDIIWIVGKRIDDRYKICSTTKTAIVLKIF